MQNDYSFRRELEVALKEMSFPVEKSEKYGRCELTTSLDRTARGSSVNDRHATTKRSWRPVSPSGKTEMNTSIIDASPSITFQRNPMTMGIFQCRGISPPHSAGDGKWRPSSRRRSYFSVPPRMEWRKAYTPLESISISPERARSLWVASGIIRGRSKRKQRIKANR
jgi:hypothetical protein